MGLQRYIVNFPRLSHGLLLAWRAVPSRVAAGLPGCTQAVAPAIRTCAPGARLCGQARTVTPMPGDNSVLLAACGLAEPGEVVVVGGAGLDSVAVAGEWVTRRCQSRGLGGLVIDGAVRDLPDIRNLGFPVFARGAVPRAPHRSIGGKMDLPVTVGGVRISPGDLLIGDDDGIAVVPLIAVEEALRKCQDRMSQDRMAWDAGTPSVQERRPPLLTALGIPDANALEGPVPH